jgi:uncharacterized damage-inducible protein DinB
MESNSLIADLEHEFHQYRQLAERAMVQLDDEAFFRRPGEQVNSVALIVKHLSGNLLSRWTDFLTTDGEEPSRNRDDEFIPSPDDTRSRLMERWQAGWSAVENTLQSLQDSDLQKTITIRGEPHTVQQALLRGLNHAAYHTGQILYVVRFLKPDAMWLTIAPGQSKSFRPGYRSR